MGRRKPDQCGVLAYRVENEQIQILLVTTRDTGRWIIPKGWMEKQIRAPEMAAREAYEEAGVNGAVEKKAIGKYTYLKKISDKKTKRCQVKVYLMRVDEVLEQWPENTQRSRRWCNIEEAQDIISDSQMKDVLEQAKIYWSNILESPF